MDPKFNPPLLQVNRCIKHYSISLKTPCASGAHFFIPFMLYMMNGREISSGDPAPTIFVAVNLVKQGTVLLDDLHEYIPYHNLPYYVSEQRNHIVSNYPVFPGIMSAPVFAPFVWLGMIEKGDGDLVWKYLAKLSGALFTALSVLVFYHLLRRLIDADGAAILAFSHGLGTASAHCITKLLAAWTKCPLVVYFALLSDLCSSGGKPQSECSIAQWNRYRLCVLCRTVNGIGMAVLCMIILLHYRSRPFLHHSCFIFNHPAAFLQCLFL